MHAGLCVLSWSTERHVANSLGMILKKYIFQEHIQIRGGGGLKQVQSFQTKFNFVPKVILGDHPI